MDSYLNLPLGPEQFRRLNFEEGFADHWVDADSYIWVYKLDNGTYQQYIPGRHGKKLDTGIPLKTVGDLMKRFNKISGLSLIYLDKKNP